MQLADHVAYAVFRRYEHGDSQYFDVVASRFDSAGGVVHGLVHRQNIDPLCICLACVTRRPSEGGSNPTGHSPMSDLPCPAAALSSVAMDAGTRARAAMVMVLLKIGY